MGAQIVAIDGNIGVGKTTFAKTYGYHLIEEPVEDNPYLDRFYADPRKYAFEMERWFMEERARALLRAIDYVGHGGRS